MIGFKEILIFIDWHILTFFSLFIIFKVRLNGQCDFREEEAL